MSDFIDWLGKTIAVGDFITYTVRQGSDMYMVKAKVLDCQYREHPYYYEKAIPVLKVKPMKSTRSWLDLDRTRTVSLKYVTKI